LSGFILKVCSNNSLASRIRLASYRTSPRLLYAIPQPGFLATVVRQRDSTLPYIALCLQVSTANVTIRQSAVPKINSRVTLNLAATVAAPAEASAIGPIHARYW